MAICIHGKDFVALRMIQLVHGMPAVVNLTPKYRYRDGSDHQARQDMHDRTYVQSHSIPTSISLNAILFPAFLYQKNGMDKS